MDRYAKTYLSWRSKNGDWNVISVGPTARPRRYDFLMRSKVTLRHTTWRGRPSLGQICSNFGSNYNRSDCNQQHQRCNNTNRIDVASAYCDSGSTS